LKSRTGARSAVTLAPVGDWVTTAQVAAAADASPGTVLRWAEMGVLPAPEIYFAGARGRRARWPVHAPAQAAWVHEQLEAHMSWDEIRAALGRGDFSPTPARSYAAANELGGLDMTEATHRIPYSVELSITPCNGAGSQLHDLTLTDHQYKGWVAGGSARLDFADAGTRDFLRAFLRGDAVLGSQGLAFGLELAARLFSPERLGADWRIINDRRAGRPLRLEIVLPADTDMAGSVAPMVALDDIPFELLADPGTAGFWFLRPGWSLVRTFEGLRAKAYQLPRQGRALLAWANPLVERADGTPVRLPGALFDEHEAVFAREVTALGMEPRTTLRRATIETLGACLRERPETPLLSLIAHGDAGGGTLVLHAGADNDEGVGLEARAFAKVCRDGGVKVALLWSCHGAKRHARRSSIAAALLEPDIGDVAAVVASHAALVAERTVRFVAPLLRSLRDVAEGDLERAVTEARHALGEDDLQWAAPAYYARPYQGRSVSLEESLNQLLVETVAPAGREVEGIPQARPWFRGRNAEIVRSLALLRAHRLVTFEGMPGTGKTALAMEVSRRALDESVAGVDRAVWLDLSTKASAEALRESLVVLLALDPSRCKDDLAFAKALEHTRALLVFDNAEDLLHKDGDGLHALLDTLLRYARDLRMLATSRRAFGALEGGGEQVFPVGRLPKGTDREVFLAVAGERLAGERADDATVDALVTALDGHPQSIVLVAGQVGRGLTLRELLARVQAEDAGVVQDFELLHEDIEGAPDLRLRARRLANSLNLSFRPLVKNMPRAAEIFAWLGVFPAGLPGALVELVFGDGANRYAGRLLGLNMVERRGPDDRLTLPGPIRWYARAQQGTVLDGIAVIAPSRHAELIERSVMAMEAWLMALREQLGHEGSAAACTRAAAEGTNLIALSPKMEGAPAGVLVRMAGAFASYAQLAVDGRSIATAVVVGEHVRTAMLLGVAGAGTAIACKALGDLYVRTDRLADAERVYGEALPLFRAIEARLGEANTLLALGDFYVRTARLPEAEQVYPKALSLYRAIEERQGEANTLLALGYFYVRTDRLTEAERVYKEALPIFRANKERLGEAATLKGLGDLYVRMDRLTEAEQVCGEALPVYRAIADRLGEANTLRALGDLYTRTARLTEAEQVYGKALTIYRAIEGRLGEARTLQGLGRLALARQVPGHAFRFSLESLAIQDAIDDRLGMGGTHGYLARAATLAGRFERAIVLGCRSFAILQQIDDTLGQMTAVSDLLPALIQMQDEGGVPTLVLAWVLAKSIDHPIAQKYESMIRQSELDLHNIPLDDLRDEALAALQSVSERYEQILCDRGEDPYSPLEPV
jgi:tetratricopeptide (TPR) repeat protein